MKYYNYTDLEIVSAKYPFNAHLITEVSTSQIYMVDSTNQKILLKSVDKGENWTTVTTRTRDFVASYPDLANDKIYYVTDDRDGTRAYLWYLDTTDDSENAVQDWVSVSNYTRDVVLHGGDLGMLGTAVPIVDCFVQFVFWNAKTTSHNMGTVGVRTLWCSRTILIGDDFWFLFRWSDENIELWKADISLNTCTQMADLGADSTFPDDNDQNGISYDGSDIIYFVIKDDGDGKHYLWTYSIGDDVATKKGEFNIVLMLDRNTASGVLEKGFHLTEYNIYQIQTNNQQLNLISKPDTDAIIITITDSLFMNDDGDIWEYEDQINKFISVDINHEIMEAPYAIITQKKDNIPIEDNMFIKIYSNYTTAGATSEKVIFEGIITSFTDKPLQTIFLRSLAKKDLDSRPSGDKTVDSDGMITSIISSDCEYITAGTLTDGADLGVITLGGELSSEFIFDVMVYFEDFIWYLTPTGELYFNDGSVDTTENLSEASKVFNAKPVRIREEYNKIKVKGAYVDGIQVESDWQEDLESQHRIGINRKTFDLGILDTAALCNTAATNLLARLANLPKIVKFVHQDSSIGFMQPGETITFEFESEGIVIASDQYLIHSVVYNEQDIGYYTITNELI